MSASHGSILVSDDLYNDLEQQASHDGVAIEEWVSHVLAERIRVQRQTEEFFRSRIAHASDRSLFDLLSQSKDNPPMPGDEMEP